MLDGGAGGFDGNVTGPEMIRMKTVIAHQDHVRLVIGEFQQSAQHRVMVAVGVCDDVLKDCEILLGDPGQPRGMIPHEGVAEMVNATVINRGEIPRLGAEQLGRHGVDRHSFGDNSPQRVQPLVSGLVQLLVIRNKPAQELTAQFHGVYTQLAERRCQCGRVDRAGGQWR